jgi:hypothetical protein
VALGALVAVVAVLLLGMPVAVPALLSSVGASWNVPASALMLAGQVGAGSAAVAVAVLTGSLLRRRGLSGATAGLSRSDASQFALIATVYGPGLVLLSAAAAVGVVALLAMQIVSWTVEALFSSGRS